MKLRLEEARMRRITGGLWAVLALSLANTVLADERRLTLHESTRLALTGNPDIQRLATSVEAARARLAGASLLLPTNPVVTVQAGPRTSPAGKTLDHGVQALQQFEVAGQRGARVAAAKANLSAAEAQLQALKADVAARVRETFGQALAAEERVQLAGEAFALAEQGVDAASQRFEAGAAALLEVNTARVEIGRAARDRGEGARRRAGAIGDLHLLLGLEPTDVIIPQGELRSAAPIEEAQDLLRTALANRAELDAARHGLEAARAEARLAAKEWIPSPRIGASYSRERESDTSIVQGIVSIDVPLFNRNRAARGVAAARVREMEVALSAVERGVTQDVLTAYARVQAAQSSADGYAEEVVKAMQENMGLVTESYQAGKIDFLQLLLIRRRTLEARGEYIDVLEELNSARALLDRAIGRRP